ncbi:MAG: helicase PcrA [Pseudomonadota bacterium]
MNSKPDLFDVLRPGGIRGREDAKEACLEGLCPVQREAAAHVDGPMVIFAGAGSGKTRVITRRIAHLIESGVPPWQILAVTFTNKAAGEMRGRVEALTPFGSRALISTFHSACARWLREYADEAGFTSDFTIYDDSDTLSAMKAVLKEFDVKLDKNLTVGDYRGFLHDVKTEALFPHERDAINRMYGQHMPPAALNVYKRYQEVLAASNAMDFDDLLMNMLFLMRNNAKVRSAMQQKYRYVLVDEYQDTNKTQNELLTLLAASHRNLCVVGDDDQSIYSWRGASPQNILDFSTTYPEAKVLKLEQNYRSSANIVNAASAVIGHNTKRAQKKLWTAKEEGEPIQFRIEADEEVEAWAVARSILDELSVFPLKDVAIFYRTNSQSRPLEEALRRDRIPYRVYGALRFYDRAEIKDLMAYMRLLANPADDVSLRRVINVPARGIGDTAVDQLAKAATSRGKPMLATLRLLADENAPRVGPRYRAFAELLDELRAQLAAGGLANFVETLVKLTGYRTWLEAKHPDKVVDKLENIHDLAGALAVFEEEGSKRGLEALSDWLQSVTLVTTEDENAQGVSLMTLHSAKGLEFDRVYVVGVEDGLLPYGTSSEDEADLEEERRLFYVGMTRARKKLSLSCAFRRRVFNNTMANMPSRFLKEIPRELLASDMNHKAVVDSFRGSSHHGGDEDSWDTPTGSARSASQEPFTAAVGDRVQHPTYGGGEVIQIIDEFGHIKAVVDFDGLGKRKVAAHHLEPDNGRELTYDFDDV